MASSSTCFSMEEGQSIAKPPFFNGANYPYWKNRMMLFIQSTDYLIWDVVLDESRRVQMNDKAMHILFCALGPDEYAKMSSCSIAKEIWDKLEVTHEGTSEVNETKIGLLNLSYENFKMEPDEHIKKMFDRFSVIVNGLKGYGEIIPEDKLVRKLIYSLPESWDSKKTAIIEAKNLKTLKLDELMGSLLNHELMKQGKRDEEKKKEEKKDIEKKKIGIALKASLESDSSDEDDEEMAFLAKRFTRFMKSNRGRKFLRKGEFKNKNREEEKDQLIFYECKKLGHIRTECPQLKKKSFGKKKKLKAHVATWSDEESSDEDEEENWEKSIPLVEFAYNNSYQTSIQMAPFEALYGRRCRTPICWSELGENKVLGPQMIQDTEKQVKIIHDRLKQAFDRQKAYADTKR
ncbi:hypothetical protein GQ457_11G025630 [Hibiscus cannabinus]